MMKLFLLFIWITLSLEKEMTTAMEAVDLFVLQGRSVHLTVKEAQKLKFRRLNWKINSTFIMEYTQGNNYTHLSTSFKEKVEFNSMDLSMHIKNLTETDSGVYVAEIVDSDLKLTDWAKYNLVVQEAVPKPTLNFMLLNSTEGFCRVSVNCSVKNNWVCYTCDHNQCTQVELWSHLNITVTIDNANVLCTCSNRVSNEFQTEPVKNLCSKLNSLRSSNIWWIIGACLCAPVVLLSVAVCRKKFLDDQTCTFSQKTRTAEDNTVYVIPGLEPCQPNSNQQSPKTVYTTLHINHWKAPPSHSADKTIYSKVDM